MLGKKREVFVDCKKSDLQELLKLDASGTGGMLAVEGGKKGEKQMSNKVEMPRYIYT